MPVKRDASGRRYVEAEVEVPGPPEDVWRAIATGPGISSWFVPTEVEEREGGAVRSNFGPGMDSASTITAGPASPNGLKSCSSDSTSRRPASPTLFLILWAARCTCGSVSTCTATRRPPPSRAPNRSGERG